MATTMGSWSIENGTTYKFTPTDSNESTITISGLKDNLITDGEISGITVDSDNKTVTLTKDVLDEAEVTLDDGDGYKLALASGVTTTPTQDYTWTLTDVSAEGTNATYGGTDSAYYTLDDDSLSITYTEKKTVTGVANITGLNANVTVDNLTDATDTIDKTITLTNGMLGRTDVILTSPKYKLALSSVASEAVTTAAAVTYDWSELTSGEGENSPKSSTLSINATEYYTLDGASKKLTYKKAESTPQFMLSNIASTFNGSLPTITKNNKVVTLTADMLNKSTTDPTTLTHAGSVTGYTLALADGVPTSSSVKNVDMWTAKAATAEGETAATHSKIILATYKPEHFALSVSGNTSTVNYTAQAQQGGALVEITGLEGVPEKKTPQDDIPLTGVTVPTTGTETVITLASGVLPTANDAVISVTGTKNYTLALASDTTTQALAWAEKATVGNSDVTDYWTVVDGTGGLAGTKTVTYQYDSKAGFKASDDNKKLTYTDSVNTTILTIDGLKVSSGGETIDNQPAKFRTVTGITLNEDKSISLDQDILYTDANKGSITNTPTATLTDTENVGYTLAYKAATTGSTIIKNENDATTGTQLKLWTATAAVGEDTGTATYAEYTPEHFKVGSGGTSISYVAQARTKKEDNSGTKGPLATITGLNIENAIEEADASKTFSGIGIEDTTLKIDKTLLYEDATNPARLISSTYKLGFGNGVTAYTKQDTRAWVVDNTNAIYQQDATVGWELDSDTNAKTMTYNDTAKIAIAELTGVKSDANKDTLNAEGNVNVDEENKKITLNKAALDSIYGTSAISAQAVDGGETYTLELGEDAEAKVTGTVTVTNNNGTGEVKGAIEGYKKLETGSIESAKTTTAVVLAEISNLNNAENPTGTLSFSNSVITLGRGQLGTNTMELTTTAAAADVKDTVDAYMLKIGNQETKQVLDGDATVSVANDSGEATIKGDLVSYSLSDDKKFVNYVKKENETLATISGLKESSQLRLNGTDTKQVDLTGAALNGKNITLTNKFFNVIKYKLGWAESDADASSFRKDIETADVWDVTKGQDTDTDTATYKQVIRDYYDLEDYKTSDNTQTVAYKKQADVEDGKYFDISGLKKDSVTVENGEITGNVIEIVENVANPKIELKNSVLDNKTGADPVVFSPVGGKGYEDHDLALASDVTAYKQVVDPPEYYWTITEGTGELTRTTTLTYQCDNQDGYEIYTEDDKKKIRYRDEADTTVLFTITGINSNVTGTKVTNEGSVNTNITKYATIDNVELNTETSKITIKQDALGASDVTLTIQTENNPNYVLVLNNVAAPALGTTTYYTIKESDGSSTVDYKVNMLAGHTLDEGSKKITYHAETPHTIATITGLKTGLASATGTVALKSTEEAYSSTENRYSTIGGINYKAPTDSDEGSFELDSTVLNEKDVALTTGSVYTGDDAYKNRYELKLQTTAENQNPVDGDVAQKGVQNFDWSATNTSTAANVTVKEVTEPYYELGKASNTSALNDKVKYTARNVGSTVATISGLNPDVGNATTNEVFKTYFTLNPYQAEVKDDTSTPDKNEATPAVLGTIALKAGALNANNKKNIVITSEKYRLALDEEAKSETPVENITEPKVISGELVLKGTVNTEGYSPSTDGKTLDFVAANSTASNLVKISGLQKLDRLVTDAAYSNTLGYYKYTSDFDEEFIPCIKYDDANNTVTILSADVLGSSDVKFTANKLGYKLKLDEEEFPEEVTEPATANVWRETSTKGTYEYKKINVAQYSVDESTNSIVCQAETDVKEGTKSVVYAKVVGLKSGLETDNNGIYCDFTYTDNSGNAKTVVSNAILFDGGEDPPNGTFTVQSKNALNSKTVSITGEGFALKVSDDCTAKTVASPTWSTATATDKTTTATYSADFTDGYIIKDNKIEYVAAKSNVKIATITGLNIVGSIQTAKDGDLTDKDGNILIDVDSVGAKLALYKNVLGQSNIVLSSDNDVSTNYGYDYKLALNKLVTAEEHDRWWLEEVTGNKTKTASWATVKPEYYTLDGDTDKSGEINYDETGGKKVTYTAAAITEGGVKGTVKGLKSDVVFPDDDLPDYSVAGTYNGSGDFVPGLEVSGTKILVASSVIPEGGTITLENSEKLSLQYENNDLSEDDSTEHYVYSLQYDATTGTATVLRGNEEYYKTDDTNKKIIHHLAKDPETEVAKITGLSKELGVAEYTDITGGIGYALYAGDTPVLTITAPENAKDLTNTPKIYIVDKGALAKETIKVTGTGGYTLDVTALSTENLEPQSGKKVYTLRDGGDGVLAQYTGTTAGYKFEDGKYVYTRFNANDKTSIKEFEIKGLTGITAVSDDGSKVGKLDANGEFIPINIEFNGSTGTVTFGENALGASNVSFTHDDANKDLKLELTGAKAAEGDTADDANKYFGFGDVTEKWAVDTKKGTATCSVVMPAGYTVSKDERQIRYTAPVTVTETITGLDKDKLAMTENNKISGIELTRVAKAGIQAVSSATEGENLYDEIEAVKGQITIADNLLNEANVKVTSSNKNYAYTLAGTNGNTAILSDITPTWTVKGGKATYDKKVGAEKYVANDTDTITYYKSEKVLSNVATISGLDKNLKTEDFDDAVTVSDIQNYDADNKLIVANDTTTEVAASYGTITMNTGALAVATGTKTAKFTLTYGKEGEYRFALATGVAEPTKQTEVWTTNKGSATYQYETTAGYTLTDSTKNKSDVINYTAATTTALVTISGLKKLTTDITAAGKVDSLSDKGIEIAGNTITLTKITDETNSLLSTSAVKLKNNTKDPEKQYTLSIDSDLAPGLYEDPQWILSGTSVSLKGGTRSGFTLKGTDTANFVKENLGTTIVTLSGFDKNVLQQGTGENAGKVGTTDSTGKFTSGFSYNADNHEVTLSEGVLKNKGKSTSSLVPLTGTIKLGKGTDTESTLKLDSGLEAGYDAAAWSISKGKATYSRKVNKAGYEVATDGKSISYIPEKVAKSKVETDNVITLATISGLNKDWETKTENNVTTTKDAAGNDRNLSEYLNVDGTKVTVTNDDILSTSKASISKGYTLALNSDKVNVTQKGSDGVDSAVEYWTVGNGKAVWAKGTKGYYSVDNKGAIVYNKPGKATTIFTISGLAKTATESDLAFEDGTVTEVQSGATVKLSIGAFDTTSEKALGKTKVTIKSADKNKTYNLDLDITSDKKVTQATASKSWNFSNGKATLEEKVGTNDTAGYSISSDNQTITYLSKDSKATAIATLSGIKAAPTSTTGKITLDSEQLNGKKVTLKVNKGFENDGYKLGLADSAAPTVTPSTTALWSTPKNGKVTVMGNVTGAGYTLSDNYNVNYTAAASATAKDKALATITGLKSSITTAEAITSTVTGSKVTMSGADLDTKVTVDGGGVMEFSFGNDYSGTVAKNNSIVGGSKDDTIAVAGGNLVINPGKGNDHIDLGSSDKGNTFIYASGDGNDFIANFTEGKDKITFTSGKAPKSISAAKDGSDVVITVDKNTITLEGYTGNSVTVGGKSYTVSGAADLLLDDNYSMTAAADDFGSIIKADTGSYSPYQFSNSLKLTKEENFIPQIAYGNKE